MGKKKTPFEMVQEFHRAFKVEGKTKFTEPSPELLRLRGDLIGEELEELSVEMAKLEKGENYDPYAIAKELCDLVYVLLGLADTLGIPFDKCFKEVHRSNMSKLDENGNPIYREDGKVIKSNRYSPANLTQILQIEERAK